MKLGCLAFLLGATFFAGAFYGDWASRQRRITVDLELPRNAVRRVDGNYQWSETTSEDGRHVIIVWRR